MNLCSGPGARPGLAESEIDHMSYPKHGIIFTKLSLAQY